MKKIILISSGVLFILLLAGIWLYLLFYGPPETVDDVFSDFSFGGDAPVVEPEPTTESDTEPASEIETDASREQNPLRQITSAAVAGKTILETNTNNLEGAATSSNERVSTTIRYVEAGTGHVYDYDLHQSERTRISSVTIPEARQAYISPGGSYIIVESRNQLRLIEINDDDTVSPPQELSFTVENAKITRDNFLVYTNSAPDGTTGYAYNLETNTERVLFSTPMRYMAVSWGTLPDSQHIIYPRPADSLVGYAYRITPGQNQSERLPISGYGLTLLHYGNNIFYSTISSPDNPHARTGYSHNMESRDTRRLTNIIVPEKCTYSEYHERLWCANDSSQETSLSNWYKGTATYSDSLWSIDTGFGSSRHQINPMRAAGRSIDVAGFHTQNNQPIFLLTNKIDRALWVHDPTL